MGEDYVNFPFWFCQRGTERQTADREVRSSNPAGHRKVSSESVGPGPVLTAMRHPPAQSLPTFTHGHGQRSLFPN